MAGWALVVLPASATDSTDTQELGKFQNEVGCMHAMALQSGDGELLLLGADCARKCRVAAQYA